MRSVCKAPSNNVEHIFVVRNVCVVLTLTYSGIMSAARVAKAMRDAPAALKEEPMAQSVCAHWCVGEAKVHKGNLSPAGGSKVISCAPSRRRRQLGRVRLVFI